MCITELGCFRYVKDTILKANHNNFTRLLSLFYKKALQWADKNLDNVKLQNSAGTQAKRTYVNSSDGHKIGVGKTFFTEMMHKNRNNKELPYVVEAATHFKEWIPASVHQKIEDGYDHDFKFSVYTVEWGGRTIEFKCKITDGELIYNMRFIK